MIKLMIKLFAQVKEKKKRKSYNNLSKLLKK